MKVYVQSEYMDIAQAGTANFISEIFSRETFINCHGRDPLNELINVERNCLQPTKCHTVLEWHIAENSVP